MIEPRLRAGVFVGTRADLAPLFPVLRALSSAPDIDLAVATAIGFDSASLAEQFRRLALDIEPAQVGPRVADTAAGELARAGAKLSRGLHDWLVARRIEVLGILGDRWELMYAVPPAVLLGVRVVHLHGGEITEGAIDDRVRHALTKLADQHAVATEDAAHVVRQLGEPGQRIHHTGAPGLDTIAAARPLDESGWRAVLGQVPQRPLALVTVHPATASDDEDPALLTMAVLGAVLETCRAAIVTHPGPDPGGAAVLAAVEAAASREPDRLRVVASLGPDYPSVLRSVDVVVGNSSSGVIEAHPAGVPAVDVGDRQAGRLRAASVRHAPADHDAVAAAIRDALADPRPSGSGPYGDGHAAHRIVDVFRAAASSSRRKPFVRITEKDPR